MKKKNHQAQISFSIADLPLNIHIESLFDLAKKCDVDGIEIVLGYKTFSKIQWLAKLSRHYCIPILSIHQPLFISKLFYSPDKVFQITQFFQAKLIIHPLRSQPIASPRQLDYLFYMSQLQKKYNVEVLLENMSLMSSLPLYKYFSKAEISTTKIMDIYKISKKYHFGITFDTSHFSISNIHENKDFKFVLPNIKNIHLSDFDKDCQHLPLGRGILEVRQFLQFLKKSHYSHLITLELSPHFYSPFHFYSYDIYDSIQIIRAIYSN